MDFRDVERGNIRDGKRRLHGSRQTRRHKARKVRHITRREYRAITIRWGCYGVRGGDPYLAGREFDPEVPGKDCLHIALEKVNRLTD